MRVGDHGERQVEVLQLQKYYCEQGIEGLKRQPRRDEGALRVDDSWRELIVERYRNGNRGMRKTSRAQIAKLQLSAMLGQRSYVVSYWESPSRQRRPAPGSLHQLSQMSGVAIARLHGMWSPSDTRLHWPTRLCPACYAEAPWHRLTWQLNDQPNCEIHQRRRSRPGETSLLAQCPRCHHAFPLPSHWVSGQCAHCQLPFAQMRC